MEDVDIVDENGKFVERASRDKAHREGLLHQSVLVFIMNSQNQVLLQLRKKDKKQYPLLWAGSVNGHIKSGDSAEQTAHREMKEEIGIDTDLEFVGKFIVDDGVEHELVHIFFGRSDGPLSFEEREIEKVWFFDAEELGNEIKMTPHCRQGLKMVLEKYF